MHVTENTQKLVREVVLTRHALNEAQLQFERAKREVERTREAATKAEEMFKKSAEDGQYVFRNVLLKRWSGRGLQNDVIVDMRIEEAAIIPDPKSILNPAG